MPWNPGDRVRLHGLNSRPELNGTSGTILDFVAEKGRYAVLLLGPERILVKATNLMATEVNVGDSEIIALPPDHEIVQALRRKNPKKFAKSMAEWDPESMKHKHPSEIVRFATQTECRNSAGMARLHLNVLCMQQEAGQFDVVLEAGAMEAALALMDHHRNDADVHQWGCNVVRNCTFQISGTQPVSRSSLSRALKANAPSRIIEALRVHTNNANVQEGGLHVLSNFGCHPSTLRAAVLGGGIACVTSAIRGGHRGVAALLALHNMTNPHDAAYEKQPDLVVLVSNDILREDVLAAVIEWIHSLTEDIVGPANISLQQLWHNLRMLLRNRVALGEATEELNGLLKRAGHQIAEFHRSLGDDEMDI